MERRWKILIVVVTLLAAVGASLFFAEDAGRETPKPKSNEADDTETVEVTRVEESRSDDILRDDEYPETPEFIYDLIDTRPFGPEDNQWQINASAAVIELDVEDTRSDEPASMHRLYAEYASAIKAIRADGYRVLPSVNALAAKAKQFDDGLYAALDLYMVNNAEHGVRDIEILVRQILTELNPIGEAYKWLWASLEVGGFISAGEYQQRPRGFEVYLDRFLKDKRQSRPVGFYTWNENLERAFRFLRYLQQPFETRDGIPNAIGSAINQNPTAVEQYRSMLEFYAGLTNPFSAVNMLALANPDYSGLALPRIAFLEGVPDPTAHFLPYSRSKETALFQALYPLGLPRDADLMRDLVKAIRDGNVDLTPDADSGWYDHQIYALETLLLPGRGEEGAKLILGAKYKQRLIEAFKAKVTTIRETHIRQEYVGGCGGAPPEPEEGVSPRLRVEPNPTYFLRMARSYSFLQNLLESMIEDLNQLSGLREDGLRELPLADELKSMRLLFYGLYFVSCEDIGLRPQDLTEELPFEPAYPKALAAKWLDGWSSDPDLQADTRVGVPIYDMRGVSTRFWVTLGVRPVKLTAIYAEPPRWRAMQDGESTEWVMADMDHEPARWVILVDEFAEVARPGGTLTREELRSVCDSGDNKEDIVEALQR